MKRSLFVLSICLIDLLGVGAAHAADYGDQGYVWAFPVFYHNQTTDPTYLNSGCLVFNEYGFIAGYGMMVDTTCGGEVLTCLPINLPFTPCQNHLLTEQPQQYPMNRVWDPNNEMLGCPCIRTTGDLGTLVTKCATPFSGDNTKGTACGYLYCTL